MVGGGGCGGGGVSLQKRTPPPFPPSSSLHPLAPHATETGCKNRDDNDTLSCLRGEKRGRENDRDRVTSRT